MRSTRLHNPLRKPGSAAVGLRMRRWLVLVSTVDIVRRILKHRPRRHRMKPRRRRRYIARPRRLAERMEPTEVTVQSRMTRTTLARPTSTRTAARMTATGHEQRQQRSSRQPAERTSDLQKGWLHLASIGKIDRRIDRIRKVPGNAADYQPPRVSVRFLSGENRGLTPSGR